MASTQELMEGLVKKIDQITAPIGISRDDAIVQAMEVWCFLTENGLMAGELFGFQCRMTSPAGVGIVVQPLSEDSSIRYMQYNC